jgi:hypothetical protein
MRFALLAATTAALALGACDSAADNESVEPAPTATAEPLPAEIPAAFRGRWGLVAEDCTSDRGDAKGLLEVGATELRFYESVGALSEVTGATQDRFRGDFAFTGEGMEWQRDEVLDLREGGKVLVRREFGEGASPEPFDYTRCQ